VWRVCDNHCYFEEISQHKVKMCALLRGKELLISEFHIPGHEGCFLPKITSVTLFARWLDLKIFPDVG
jgi:hypothetical protein